MRRGSEKAREREGERESEGGREGGRARGERENHEPVYKTSTSDFVSLNALHISKKDSASMEVILAKLGTIYDLSCVAYKYKLCTSTAR